MHANLAIKIHSRVCFPDFLSQLIVFNAERATPIRPALTPPRCLTTITTTTVVSIQTAVVDGSRERTDTGRKRRDIIKELQDTAKPTPSDVAVTIIRLIADRETVISQSAIVISCREILLSRRASTLFSIPAESAAAGVPLPQSSARCLFISLPVYALPTAVGCTALFRRGRFLQVVIIDRVTRALGLGVLHVAQTIADAYADALTRIASVRLALIAGALCISGTGEPLMKRVGGTQ